MRIQLPIIVFTKLKATNPIIIPYAVYSSLDLARKGLLELYRRYNTYDDLEGYSFTFYENDELWQCSIHYIDFNRI